MSEDYCGLYEQEQSRLIGWMYKRVGSYDLAQDMAQTVWLRLWQYKDTVRDWHNGVLYSAAKYTLIDHLRLRRMETVPLDPRAHYAQVDQIATVLDQIEVAEALALVAQLTPVYRDTLTMFAYGRSYEEIGIALAVPVGTVRSRINYARNTVRKRRTV